MKKLQNLRGAKALNKKEQQSINGGGGCTDSCSSWNFGDPCVDSCGNSGVCAYNVSQGKYFCGQAPNP